MQHAQFLLLISVLLNIILIISSNQIDYGHPLYELQLGQQPYKEIYHLQREVIDEAANIQPPPPPDVSSLTFVFDQTGSMNDDLNQVRHGAKGIFETVMKQRKKLIYNFVLVLFHDPEVSPPFITTDPDLFQQQLASVSVQGGGDCPEMALSGIKKALEVSLPGSYIYVFTDARSKDFHLESAVLNLIQEKQSSVVFVMTGDCGNRSAPGYKVFERIAAASFGQVFHLEKSHVNTVLEYVRHSVARRKVHILYEVREHGQTHTSLVPIDTSFSELVVSLAGVRDDSDLMDIELVDPHNRRIDKYEHDDGTINLKNIKLVRLLAPVPGIWRVRTSSRLKHTLLIFGHGDIDFKYGFSSQPVSSIDLTHPRPVAGQPTYLLIKMTGLRPPGALEHVSLVDYNGNELYRNESRLYPGNSPFLHFVGPLIPPKIFFFVRVRGKDAQNYEFLRIAPTAIAAVDVVGPRAYMAERHTANAYSAVNLTCSIESRVPFTVHWLFGSRTIGGPLFYESTDTSTWTIDSVTPAHRGYYTCLVVSSLGNHSVSTFLETKELPPDIIAMRNESVMLHETAFLHCITQSIERPRINWMHNHSLNVGNSAKTYTYDNGTLRIHDASFEDVGTYTCRARTTGGQSEETVWLTVMLPPSVRVEPRELYSVEGTTFTLRCITTGVPKPDVTWFFRGSPIFSDPKFYISQRDELIVSDVEDEDEGSYSCQAKNIAGNAIASAYVQIAVPPTIHVSQNKQMITKDDSIILDCQVITGIPPPTIVWWKDGRQLFNDRYIQIQEGGRLTIPRADISDAGTYACKAENIAGSAIKPLTLGVGSPPTILPSPETVYVQIGQTATLNCRVDGNPKPQIQWLKNGFPIDGLIEEQLRYSQLPDDSLHIRGSTLSDQSTFTCIVRNQFGEQRKRTNLVITGLVSPVLASLPSKMELVEGRDLQINCVVLLGNPRPEIEWFKDGQPLSKTISNEHVMILRDGSLLLKNGSDAHKGTYTCKAKSAAGNALQDVNVQLIMKPRMLQSDIEDVLVAKDGAQLEIPCPVLVPEGQVRPKVLWAHDSQPLNVNTPEYVVLPNLSLRILRVSSAHIGRYTCTAVNEAGKLEKTTIVLAPPKLGTDAMLEVMQGEVLPMNCDLQNPGESTTITWLFNNSTNLPTNVSIQSGGSWLHIVDAQIASHQGTYTCLAENSVGKARRQFNVNILEPPRFIDTSNTKYLLLQGQTVMLDCTLKGAPWPKIVWKKDNKPLELDHTLNDLGEENDNEPQYQLIDNDQILHISEVDVRHAGRYSCNAESRAGRAEKDISVSLLTAPVMAMDQTSTEIIENESHTLDCPLENDGGSTTELYWTKDEMPIGQVIEQVHQQSHVQRSMSGRKLHVMKAQRMDSGTYKCIAKNAAGVAEAIINVLVLVPPRIEDPHGYRTLEALVNDSVQIDCIASGVPIPKIEWSHNGRSLSSVDSASLYFEDNRLKLHIDSVQPKNAGIYSCSASNKAGNSDMDIFLDVIGPPTIRAPATELNVVEGSEQRLECVVGGHPSPRVEWRKAGSSDNDPLAVQQQQQEEDNQTEEKALFTEHSYFFHIHSAGQQHAGRYTCIAKNKGGEDRLAIQLNVLVPPSIDEGERLLRVIEEGTASFECPAKGSPTPKIIWRRMPQGKVINPEDEDVQQLAGIGVNRNILLIKNLKTDDAGRYTCEASNEAGNATAEFVLEILRRPILIANPANLQLRVLEGVHAKIECQANGNPEPSIHWFRAGRPIQISSSNNNLIFSPRGDTMMLVKARRSDSGEYTCRLNNSVGEAEVTFTLTVLVPPHINETLDQNPRALRNQEIRLSCPVQGFPTPTVLWLKDGKELHFTERMIQGKVSEHQNDLWLEAVNANDAGRYTCQAVNEVGQLNTDFEVEVIAPPEFSSEGKRSFEVIEGDSVTLICPVEANPLPEIAWLHGTNPIDTKNAFFSDDKKNLTLLHASLSDGGKYICKASNVAGNSELDLQLRVFVPPQIDKSNLVASPLAILGKDMFLECPASGIPQPSVMWHKDQRQITQLAQKYVLKEENQTLSIKDIIPEDQGLYTCTVQNQAGQLREEFRLEVLLPPEMEEETAKPGDGRVPGPPLSKQEGEQLELDCPLKIKSSSLPKAATESITEEELWRRLKEDYDDGRKLRIAWSKDGRPLEPELNANIEISEYPGRRLQLHTTSISDSGEYKCIASNRAGQSYVKFLVEILSKPKIDTSRNAPEPHVIAGRPITLWCPASGNPPPTIRWFLNGVDIALNKDFRKRYRLLDQGHGLELQPTTSDDIGLWTCQAENAAGASVVNISLDVWVMPTVKMLVEDSISMKPVGSSITLLCAVNGNPEPVIHWSLRGQTIIPSAGRLIIADGGQRLEILNLRSEDAGEYQCEAQNEVGDASDIIKIDILVPPKIDKEAVELNPRLPLGRSFTLFCDVKAKPDAKITWTFNGISLENERNLPFLSVDNGKRKFLQIENISLVHRGIYRCSATNAAGNDSIEYKIDVFDPPKIELRGGTTQALENHNVVLACNASGEPSPVITWQRNGVLVETGARYSLENSFLKVADVRSSDSGIYVCVATNEAGTDQQAFTLEVLVLPKVSIASQMPTQLSVPLGGNVTLGPCKGQGYPPPNLIWSVTDKNRNDDFVPINSSSVPLRKEDYKILYNESNTTTSLYLLDVKNQTDNILQFRCSASNSAGTSHIDFNVSIVMPPVFIDNNYSAYREVRIIEGQAINISCGIRLSGQNDLIQWTHNGKPIEIRQKQQQRDEVDSLTIENITLKEAGNYTCSVRNSAGSVNSTIRVVVGIPPKVDKNNGIRVAVIRGNTAQLHCEAFGFPPPKIHWLRDQMPLNKYMPTAVTGSEKSTSGVVVSENKRTATAILHDIKLEHAGFYKCKAENWAGIDNKTVELVVLSRPIILPERDQLRLESGQIAKINCNSSGTPKPSISWQKITDPQKDILADLKKYLISDDGNSLTILNVAKDDHGIYRCIAKSEAGQAIGIRKIDVKLSQGERSVTTKRDKIYVECDENGLPIKSTYVKARGDRPQQSNDPSYIHWTEESDLDALSLNGTDGLITLCMPKMDDEGNIVNRETRRVSTLPSTNLSCSISNKCQYKCHDLANGSFQCICPDGYSLSEDGRCFDVDECKNSSSPCVSDQLCFNKLGTFSCIDNICPPKFHLDRTNQHCLPSCQNCTELPIRLYMLGLSKGVSVNTALLRLSAHDKNGRLLKRTKFNIRAESNSFNTNALSDQNFISYRPDQFHFGIVAENDGRATLHSRKLLLPGSEFLLSIRSTSSNDTSDKELKTDLVKLQANYMVLIAVSENLF